MSCPCFIRFLIFPFGYPASVLENFKRRLFAPLWHLYPIPSEGLSAFNWDWLTDEDPDPFISSYQTKRAVLGEPYILPDP
jgi:hypothetical protein